MNYLIVISRCQSSDPRDDYDRFHFRGFFRGIPIKGIRVKREKSKMSFVKGEDYVLKLLLEDIVEGFLYGREERSRLVQSVSIN